MNWFVIISGLFALFTVIGHFAIGIKSFLRPMMEAPVELINKNSV